MRSGPNSRSAAASTAVRARHVPVRGGPDRAHLRTGVWVAGNVSDVRAQLLSSAAAGLTAGEAIAVDLVMVDLAEAVPPPSPAAAT